MENRRLNDLKNVFLKLKSTFELNETIRNIRETTQERTQLRDRQRRTEKMGSAEQSTEL
jgi:hypothetical protein